MRTWLYVPADSEHKLRKAAASGSDVCIADLEDGVPPGAKASARRNVVEVMPQLDWGSTRRFVRIDPTGDWAEDVDAAVSAGSNGIVIPKASLPEDVERLVDTTLSEHADLDVALILTEDAEGVLNMAETLERVPNVTAAFFGTEDLSASLGIRRPPNDREHTLGVLETARGLFLLTTAAAGVPSVETPHLVIDDLDGVRTAAEVAARQGFAGMQAIHPSHVPIINDAFTPHHDEVERAREIINLFGESGGGALRIDGRMVDPPHLKQARRIVKLAEFFEEAGNE